MSLFQAVIFAFFGAAMSFLPFSSESLHSLIAWAAGWESPSDALQGVIFLGLTLSLLFSFRHDWASMVAAMLGRLLVRGSGAQRGRRPDEQIPLWILISSLPLTLVLLLGVGRGRSELWGHPGFLVLGLFLAGETLHRADRRGKRQKGMFDWGVWDSLLLGVGQLGFLLPGFGRVAGMLSVALFRGYNREPACRFILLCSLPPLAIQSFLLLRGVNLGPSGELSRLTFGVVLVMSFLLGIASQGAFQKAVVRFGARRSFWGRVSLVALAAGLYALRDLLKL